MVSPSCQCGFARLPPVKGNGDRSSILTESQPVYNRRRRGKVRGSDCACQGRRESSGLPTDMPDSSADRDLLIGILAVQLGFVSRESLDVAMGRWAAEKPASLVDLGEVSRAASPTRQSPHGGLHYTYHFGRWRFRPPRRWRFSPPFTVDYVAIFDDDTPHRLLELVRPDVLAKGGTTAEVVGREIVEGYDGRVVVTPALPGLSTTSRVAGSARTVCGRGAV